MLNGTWKRVVAGLVAGAIAAAVANLVPPGIAVKLCYGLAFGCVVAGTWGVGGPYLLAAGALAYVVVDQWNPPSGHGLGFLWDVHVVQGKPLDNWPYLVAAFLIYIAALFLTLLRWHILVRAQDLPLPLRDALRYGLIGMFFNSFMPGSVGGDLIKAAALARGQTRQTVAVATVIMDRVIALWALVWFVAILGSVFWLTGGLEGPSNTVAVWLVSGALIVVAVSSAVWLLLGLMTQRHSDWCASQLERLPKIGHSAAEFWRAAWMYRLRQRAVAMVLGLSWIGHVGFVLVFYCGVRAFWREELGPIPTLAQHYLLVPMGLVIQAGMPTPGGAGLGELGYGALYKLFGAEETMGVIGSVVQRVMTCILGVVGFLIYRRMRASHEVVEPVVTPASPATAESVAAIP